MTNPPNIDAIIAELSEAQRRLIPHMSDGELVYPITYTAADADVPVKDARKAVRDLRAKGLADYGTLTREDDGAMVGSGYWLNGTGMSVRSALIDKEGGRG